MTAYLTPKQLSRILYDGITDYLNYTGKIYVTPFGVFSTLKEIESITGCFRTTLMRRFRNNKIGFLNWYTISGDSPLYQAELCKFTDEIDDQLFKEGCWLDNVEKHQYGTPLKDEAIIKYLYKGSTYIVTYEDFKQGYRPHIINNEENNE